MHAGLDVMGCSFKPAGHRVPRHTRVRMARPENGFTWRRAGRQPMRGLTLVVEYNRLVATLAASLFCPNFLLISFTVGCSTAIFSDDSSWMYWRGTSNALTPSVKVMIARPNDCSIPNPVRQYPATCGKQGEGCLSALSWDQHRETHDTCCICSDEVIQVDSAASEACRNRTQTFTHRYQS